MELTKLETYVMKAIPNDDFYTEGFFSTMNTDYFLESLGKDPKVLRGALSSLVKKEIIVIQYTEDGSFFYLLDKGEDWLRKNVESIDEEGY